MRLWICMDTWTKVEQEEEEEEEGLDDADTVYNLHRSLGEERRQRVL